MASTLNPVMSTSTHQLLDNIPAVNAFAWNKLIHTHLSSGDNHLAISTYQQMLIKGVHPDKHTIPRVLTASRASGNFFLGKQVHGQALKLGFAADDYVFTSLIELYGNLADTDTAKWLFDKSQSQSSKRNLVSWTLLARLYIMDDKPRLAVDLFNQMVHSTANIDSIALATAIGACSLLKSLQDGRNTHQIARKFGLETDIVVSNSLLKMYIDCGSIRDAREVFDEMSSKDAISWTAMVGGYVKNGGINEALKLFRQMNLDGVKPDPLAISSILPACSRMAAHKQGKEIHGYLLRNAIDINLVVHNALMDMYVKSGCIEYASKIFAAMHVKDVISWTVMIIGYSFYGRGNLGIDLFRKMAAASSCVEMDQMAYVAALYACCNAKMVEDGKHYFSCIKSPTIAHCALMIALLARAGLFDEARIFMEEQQIAGQAEVLRAFLDGCRIHQNGIAGKRVIEHLCELEPLNAENYVLMSNWYAHNAKWDMVSKLTETIRDMGLKPKKACSWIEFRNKMHVFETGDTSHPRSERIYWELQNLLKEMGEKGIKPPPPNPDFSLHDVDEERDCVLIGGHSEMLAISFGLISMQRGTTIRVTKNLRVCHYCHGFAKAISELVGREIILKDSSCFHHFKDGSCSCGDFY